MTTAYRYTFPPGTPAGQVDAALAVAGLAAEGLHGAAARLDAGPALAPDRSACLVPADTPAGRALNRVFAGLLGRGLGPDGFAVERVLDPHLVPHPQSSPDGREFFLPVADPADDEGVADGDL